MTRDEFKTLLQERKAIFRKIYLTKDPQEQAKLWAQIFSSYPYNRAEENSAIATDNIATRLRDTRQTGGALICLEAAHEIERLRAERDYWRNAYRPYQ